MKYITVNQPWPTLLTCGEKQFESRSWRTHYSGPVAIHAGKTFNPDVIRLCRDEPFLSALSHHAARGWEEEDLPLGCIVGVAEMVAFHLTEIVTPAPLDLRRLAPRPPAFFPTHGPWIAGDGACDRSV